MKTMITCTKENINIYIAQCHTNMVNKIIKGRTSGSKSFILAWVDFRIWFIVSWKWWNSTMC